MPIKLPELYVVAVHELLCPLFGRFFIFAIEVDSALNVAVRAYDEGAV
jgi:hypothetical protein